MFIVDQKKIDEVFERLTIDKVNVANYSFIGFNESIDRTKILLFVDGILYGSDMFLLNQGVKEKIERERKDLCEMYTLAEESTCPVVFFVDNSRILHLAFYLNNEGKLIRPDNLANNKSFLTYWCPMENSCLVYDSTTHKMWFLSKHIGQEIKSFMHFLTKCGSFIVTNQPMTIRGLIQAFKLIAIDRGYHDKIKNITTSGLSTLVRKLNNSMNIGHCGFESDINLNNIYDIVFDYTTDDLTDGLTNGLLLSEIVENPNIINNIKEATEIIMDYNVRDIINTYGTIDSMYVEDKTVCIFIRPRFFNHNEAHTVSAIKSKLSTIFGIPEVNFDITTTDDYVN